MKRFKSCVAQRLRRFQRKGWRKAGFQALRMENALLKKQLHSMEVRFLERGWEMARPSTTLTSPMLLRAPTLNVVHLPL